MKSVTERYAAFLSAIALSMALGLVLGCERRGGELPDEVRSVQILSTVAHEKVSKAIALQNTPLENVRFLRQDGATPTSMTGAQTYLGNRAADGSITWLNTTPIYDRAEKHAHFVAYHPSATETLGTKIDWAIDGQTDLLLSQPWDAGTHSAPKTGSAEGETPLTFDHVLAQLCVVFKAEARVDLARVQAQYGKILSLTFVGTLPTATYTYATNQMTYSGTPANVALWQADCQTPFASIEVPANSNTATNAAALLAPNTGAFTMILSTEKVASIPLTIQLQTEGGNKTLEAGKKHTITVTFKIENAEVVVSGCSIVDWTAQYTASTDVGI